MTVSTSQVTPAIPGYEISNLIGRGGFANIFKARRDGETQEVALKIIHSEIGKDQQRNEKEILEAIGPLGDKYNIIPLLASLETEKEGVILGFPLCGSDLTVCVGRISIQQVKNIAGQVLNALRYLHDEKSIVHRDVKFDNVLIDSKGRLRLTDFGLSIILGKKPLFKPLAGTPRYLSPEILNKALRDSDGNPPITAAMDMWAFALMLLELLGGGRISKESELQFRGALPPDDLKGIQERLKKMKVWVDKSQRFYDESDWEVVAKVIEGGLRYNHKDRISAQEAMSIRIKRPLLVEEGVDSSSTPSKKPRDLKEDEEARPPTDILEKEEGPQTSKMLDLKAADHI